MKKFEPGQKCPDSPSMVCITRTMSADGSEFSCTNDYKLKWVSSLLLVSRHWLYGGLRISSCDCVVAFLDHSINIIKKYIKNSRWISGGSSPAETESIKCDFTSGKFVDAKGNQLHTGSIVFCTSEHVFAIKTCFALKMSKNTRAYVYKSREHADYEYLHSLC